MGNVYLGRPDSVLRGRGAPAYTRDVSFHQMSAAVESSEACLLSRKDGEAKK